MAEIRVGTSGWNYADWRERVYPRGTPARAWLAHYATLFDTVEGNSTFYRLAQRPGGGKLGGRDARRLRVRRQGQPVPHAHEAAARHGAGRRTLLRGDPAA